MKKIKNIFNWLHKEFVFLKHFKLTQYDDDYKIQSFEHSYPINKKIKISMRIYYRLGSKYIIEEQIQEGDKITNNIVLRSNFKNCKKEYKNLYFEWMCH